MRLVPVLALILLHPSAVGADDGTVDPYAPAKSVALKFVGSCYLDSNEEESLAYFSGSAERKRGGKGSAIRDFKESFWGKFSPKLELQEVFFFDENRLDYALEKLRRLLGISEDETNFGWDDSRIPSMIKGSLACVVVYKVPNQPLIYNCHIFRQIDGEYRIIYVEDN